MRAVIISCFGFYDDRLKYVKNALQKNGYTVKIYLSDFNHIKKIYEKSKEKDICYLKTIEYKKNLSLKRIYSHIRFADKISKIVYKCKPDLIYTVAPPNLIIRKMGIYKRNNDVKLILDILDLWPESLPYNFFHKKWNLLQLFWKSLRDNSLKYADLIITECNLYEKKLIKYIKNIKSCTVYLARDKIMDIPIGKKNIDRLEIGYIGQINNLIDIPLIKMILAEISIDKKVILHIIGAGIKKEIFIKQMNDVCSTVYDYGEVYEVEKITKILSNCDFGLNIMKKNVCVGLTRKSMEYLSRGIPLINNILEDTSDLINRENIGINIYHNNVDKTRKKLIDFSMSNISHEYVLDVYSRYFTPEIVSEKFNSLIQSLQR